MRGRVPRAEGILALTTLRARHAGGVVVFAMLLTALGALAQEPGGTDARKQCRRFLKIVRTHMESDRPDSAAVYARMAMECDPGQADSYWYLAHAQLALGSEEEARETLDAGTAAAPMSQRLALFRGRLCLEAGETAVARECVQKVLMLPLHRAEALYLLGRIELAEGDSLAAMELWNQALTEVFVEEGGN